MIGKFLLVALVCVSFAQGSDLEDTIEKGLNRARLENESAQRRIKSAIQNVSSRTTFIQITADDYILRARRSQDEATRTLRSVAQTTEQRAKELNKPDSVISCIRRNENAANNEIEILTNRLEIAIEKLENTNVANLDTVTLPYEQFASALSVRYQTSVKSIKECKTSSCVETIISRFTAYVNSLFAEIRSIEGQIYTIVSSFKREASFNYSNASRQVSRLRSISLRNIRQCLYGREVIFGQSDNQF